MKGFKGHGNEADFLEFLHKSVWHRSLHFERSDFGCEFAEIFVIEKITIDTRIPIDTIFCKPLNKLMVIVHYIPGLFFAKLVL